MQSNPLAGQVTRLAVGHTTVLPSMDFEVYSEAGYYVDSTGKTRGAGSQGKGGLPVVGTPVYAAHPSTEPLCLFYDLKDGRGRRGWMPGLPYPADLLCHIAAGRPIEAHNVTFEWYVWNHVCVPRYGWPPLAIEQCYCVMAKCKRHGLPGALGKASKVLGTVGKDPAGDNLIRKLCRPLTPTKNRKANRWTPATAWEDFQRMYAYCDQDVAAEDEVAARIPDLTPYERNWWLTDQRINARGVQVDVESLDAMIDLLDQAYRKYNLELATITQGAVGSVSEVAKLVEWVNAQGISMSSADKDAVAGRLEKLRAVVAGRPPDPGSHPVDFQVYEEMSANPNVPAVLRVLEIRASLGAANIKKLSTLKLQVSEDGRLRDQYMCWGADRTGRWSSGGVQLQNLTGRGPDTEGCHDCGAVVGAVGLMACPRCGSMDLRKRDEWDVDAAEWALATIAQRDLDVLEKYWGDPIAVMCGCLRALFTAKPGHDLICCDFSAVEAVAAACLSRCQWRIEVFQTHGKIYETSASKISGVPLAEILEHKEKTGQHHKLRKTLGKVAELASAYAGWINAWKVFGADSFMDDDEMKKAILRWRAESPEIVEMWGGQFRQTGKRLSDGHQELYGLEGAFVAACLEPGQTFRYIDIAYCLLDDVMYCQLPSGRMLHYHRPRLVLQEGKWGKPPEYQLTFEGYNSNPAKGPVGWQVMDTFGGRLFENVTQAVCADIQADALLRCEAAGYPIVMHTHDEGTAEVPQGWGSVEEMEAIMSERPSWASWWPLRSAGWRHVRYQKD